MPNMPTVDSMYETIMGFDMSLSQINQLKAEELPNIQECNRYSLKNNLLKLVFCQFNIFELAKRVRSEEDFIIELLEGTANAAHHKGFCDVARLGVDASKDYVLSDAPKQNVRRRMEVLGVLQQKMGIYVAEKNAIWKSWTNDLVEYFGYTISPNEGRYYTDIEALDPYFQLLFGFAFAKGLDIPSELITSGLHTNSTVIFYPLEWIYG